MALVSDAVPVLLDRNIKAPSDRVMELIDGFHTVSEILEEIPQSEAPATRQFLTQQEEQGTIVWRDEWSPLRWCHQCNLPLLTDECNRCGAAASDPIELQFPCNPRPILPHDEEMFRSAGLPWPVDGSVIINVFDRPDHDGWEIIGNGEVLGRIIAQEGQNHFQFHPSPAYSDGDLVHEGREKNIDDIIAANRDRLERLSQEAVECIRKWSDRWFLSFTAATFSGGKDSSVLAHLCHRSGVKMRVVQIDTGIDPPQTEQYSAELLADYDNLSHSVIPNGDMFWRAMDKLGPPAYDFQWCRTILKNAAPYRERSSLTTLLKYIRPILNPRIILVDGPRRREEPWRVTLKKSVEIPDSPVETFTIRPILEFTDLDVWMYIHHNDVPIHPTYTEGKSQRLECLFCPDKDCSEFQQVRRAQPAEWERYEKELEHWREVFGFPKEWIDEDLWIWDKPRSQRARDLGITSRVSMLQDKLGEHVDIEHPRQQGEGEWLARGEIQTDFDLGTVKSWLRPLGRIKTAWGGDEITVSSDGVNAHLSRTGQISLLGDSKQAVANRSKLLKNWLCSHFNCIGCGACKAALSGIRISGEVATTGWLCGQDIDGLTDAIKMCPLNPRGVLSCQSNSQYG